MDLPEHPGDATRSRAKKRRPDRVQGRTTAWAPGGTAGAVEVKTCGGLPSGYVKIANWKMAQLKLIYLLKVVIFHSYVKLYQRVYHNYTPFMCFSLFARPICLWHPQKTRVLQGNGPATRVHPVSILQCIQLYPKTPEKKRWESSYGTSWWHDILSQNLQLDCPIISDYIIIIITIIIIIIMIINIYIYILYVYIYMYIYIMIYI